MTLEEARTWLRSSAGERLLGGIDEGADDALEAAERYLRGMSDFPSSTVSEFRRLVTALERAQGAFNTEVNLITAGRARDGRAVFRAYQQYVAALVALEETNARYGAFVEQRVAELAAELARIYIANSTAMRQQLRQAIADLEALREAVTRARRDIDEAVVQMALNGVLTAIGLMLPELGIPARVAIAGSSVVLGGLIDWGLGPTGPSLSGTAISGAGAYAEFVPRFQPLIGRLGTAVSTLNNAASDAAEIEAAERILIDIQRRLRELQQRTLPELMRRVRADHGDIDVARALYEGAVRRARSAASSYRSSESEYRALMRELSNIR